MAPQRCRWSVRAPIPYNTVSNNCYEHCLYANTPTYCTPCYSVVTPAWKVVVCAHLLQGVLALEDVALRVLRVALALLSRAALSLKLRLQRGHLTPRHLVARLQLRHLGSPSALGRVSM